MPDIPEPVVFTQPTPPFYRSRIFVVGSIISSIVLIVVLVLFGIYWYQQQRSKPKILAWVDNMPIEEPFLLNQIRDECIASKSDTASQALEKWIDFLVLKKGAKDLGIEATSSSGQSNLAIKTCDEENQKFVLQNKVKQTIMPYSRVAFLATDPTKKAQLTKLISNYNSDKYPSLLAAGQAFLSVPKTATASAFNIFQRVITPDINKEGIYNDPNFLKAVFSLKEKELSSIFSPTQGFMAGKLVIIEILETGGQEQFTSFQDWFNKVKSQAVIKYINIKKD